MKKSNDNTSLQAPISSLSMFCAAAPADETLLAHWETALLPFTNHAHLISCWSEHHLNAGTDIEQERTDQLEQADLIILLLSPDFFASQACLEVMQRALLHHHNKTAQVIPLLLRPVHWQATELGTLIPLPLNSIPVTQWKTEDEAWHACLLGLQPILRHLISVSTFIYPSVRKQRRATSDRERVLDRLQQTYQSLLDQSLQGIAWMELGLASKPDAVRTAGSLLMQLPEQRERILPAGTSILAIYEQAQEELLILGAPGAGKSTLLLDLAQHIVERALTDDTYPLPIILPLSTWAIQQPPMGKWLIEQFAHTYDVPLKVSTHWVEDEHIIPLLDGLDEMEETARAACIGAINTYHKEHLTPLVVCSRQREYDTAATKTRLALQSAIVVQPLTDEQTEASLQAAGSAYIGLRMALSQQPILRELATTPLMLSVLLLTYQGLSQEVILQPIVDLEQQVWTDYVARMVQRKGDNSQYTLEHTNRWLTYLAQQMHVHQQTIFYAEYLQVDWLTSTQQKTVEWLAIRLPAIVIGCIASFLILHLVRGDADLTGNVLTLLFGGFIGDCLVQKTNTDMTLITRHPSTSKRVQLINCIFISALLAATFGINLYQPAIRSSDSAYTISSWIRDGSIVSIIDGLSIWFFQALLFRYQEQHFPISSQHSSWYTFVSARLATIAPQRVWLAALALGTGIGLSDGLTVALRSGQIEGLSVVLGAGLIGSASVMLTYIILASSIPSLRFAERISWTWQHILQFEHLRTSIILAGVLFLFFGLSYGLSVGLSYGFSFGLISGLSTGLISGLSYGLSYGLGYGLSYWLLLGLYQGITQERVKDQDRHLFNQGIRRSLRNGIFLSLISASIIFGISVLIFGLISSLLSEMSLWLNFGLSTKTISVLISKLGYGRSFGLTSAWIIPISGFLITWVLSGGVTILRHYIIRWFLARSHCLPWQAQTFLDDATTRILLQRAGGGYRFIHRRLLGYFANLTMIVTQTSTVTDTETITSSNEQKI